MRIRYVSSSLNVPSGAIHTPKSRPHCDGLCLWIGIACGICEDCTEHWPSVSSTESIRGSPGLKVGMFLLYVNASKVYSIPK